MAQERKKTYVGYHNKCIGRHAHHNGGNTIEDVRGEADRVGQLGAAAKLRKKYSAANADRNSDDAGERKKDTGTDDGVGHAAACFSLGGGNLGKEIQVERTGAFI